MRIGVIGAGNGGQAMAGHLSLLGHDVYLFNRSKERITKIIETKTIQLRGKLDGIAHIEHAGTSWEHAIHKQELIMVCTSADAHHDVAKNIAPFLNENQIIVLNPGRTLGAIAFHYYLKQYTNTKVYIAEAQSLLYACRIIQSNEVGILGIKQYVPLAAYPASDTPHVLDCLNTIFNSFVAAENSLCCGLNNIGAILHPCISLLNAQSIANAQLFYFYRNIDASTANLLEQLDDERLALGKALQLSLIPLNEWVSLAYNHIEGKSLVEKIQNNPAYHNILSPKTLHNRLLLEDIPTGLMPMIDLGKTLQIPMPLMNSVSTLCKKLLNLTFEKEARLLNNIGLGHVSKQQLIELLKA